VRLGPWAEQLAARELTQRGYEILATNYRNRHGEIDIIARHQGRIVFVEVKARRTLLYGGPRAAVGKMKQLRLRRMAGLWAAQQATPAQGYRFDVVCIQVGAAGAVESLEVFTHAF
jgi:putative endonuclease